MQNKLLPYLVMVGKISIFSLVVVAFLSNTILANNANAQGIKSVKEAKIKIALKDASLEEAFKTIEENSDYVIFYVKDELDRSVRLNVEHKTRTVEELLLEIAKQANVSFRQVNERISVKKHDGKPSADTVQIVLTQGPTVTGKVTDENGEPLPGATVVEKGTSNGTITDVDGKFSLSVSEEAVLVVTFVGYTSQEVTVGSQTNLTIQMTPDLTSLEEVVVVGYGTQKRTDLTGSVATLSREAYEDQPIVTPSSALQGRVPGVMVQNNSGAPGGEVKIRIRGANSINASNDPLYVVDGVAMASIGLQDLNINDIESMEILKDASATAIYGSRGANGVILITTKRGRSGEAEVDYNTFMSFNKPMKKYELMDAVTYANIANITAGSDVFEDPDLFAGETTDWQELIFDNSTTQSHQLSLSGGTENAKYFISGFYIDQKGLLANTSQKKYGMRVNLDLELSDRLDFGLNLYASRLNSHNNTDIGSKGNPVMSALTWAPTEPVYDDNGQYNRATASPIWLNPYMTLKERVNDDFANVGIINGRLKYDITDWLTFNTSVGLNANISETPYLNNEWLSPGNTASGNASKESYTLQTNNILTFKKVLDKHEITATAVMETTSSNYQQFTAAGTGLATLSNGYYNLGLNTTQSISSRYENWALLSYIGRLTYGFNDKYLLTATIRRDGSSKFQGSNKWSNFPSFGVGWKLSNEEFIKSLNIFSNLKLRAGWGITGNQGISPYSTLGLLTSTTYSYGTPTLYPAYTVGNPANPDVKWETTAQTDIGLDIGLFNGRVNIAADYYNKTTSDLLLSTRIANYDGGGTFLKNVGEVNNKGVELMLEGIIIENDDFTWSASVNYSANRNKVIDLGEDSLLVISLNNGLITNGIQVVKEGEPMSSFYLIPWEGVHQSESGVFQAGDAKYQDVDGNGTIGFEDRVVSGSAIPKFQFGFNNSINYKNFGLNIFVQGSYGNKIFNGTYAAASIPTSDVQYITLNDAANYWTPDNTSSTWRNPGSPNKAWVESTQFLQDGSYLRVKNVSLSYRIDKRVLKLLSAKVYVSAQNFYTITGYKGYDPEATSTPSDSDTSGGIDLGAYPSPKTFTIGAQLTF